MKTIISHFYNEQFLLPWWLNHHKKYFDHGILVNYESTDNSIDIIKNICPTWEIIDSRNKMFCAASVDNEIMDIEKTIVGWKTTLNTTEFLIGDINSILYDTELQHFIPCLYFVDNIIDRKYIDKNIPLYDQLKFGLSLSDSINERGFRSLHNKNIKYEPGRHWRNITKYNKELIIFNYGFSPMTTEFYNRKLQIQYKIPQHDKYLGFGVQHYGNINSELTLEQLKIKYKEYLNKSIDLSEIMQVYLNKSIKYV